MAQYKENREMRILSAIGIILVVAGHLGYDLFDIGGLFPYYSFHVFIFCLFQDIFIRRRHRSGSLIIFWERPLPCWPLIFCGTFFMDFWQRFCILQAFP